MTIARHLSGITLLSILTVLHKDQYSGLDIKVVVAIVVLNMKCFPHSLLCLNTGSPAGGITWEGYGAFRRESLDRRSEL